MARRCFAKLLAALVRPLDLVGAIGAFATLPERGSALEALDINSWLNTPAASGKGAASAAQGCRALR